YSHGLNRLDMYVGDCRKKVCKLDGTPTILKEKAGSAWVDGNSLLGPVVGNFCMDLAVKKAKEAGVGWVTCKGSNHFGIAGWYVLRAMKQGVMAMSFTNTSPVMYPTRAAKPALGTNPLSLGANGTGGDSYVLDMATTTVAIGKVEIAKRKGQEVPNTWGVAKGGKVSHSPDEILGGGGLLPLGGNEICGGYKGYGMGSLVEIFCGILGGAHWGPNIRKWMTAEEDADLGQCFIAVDPEAFAPGFSKRMQEFMNTMRDLPSVDPTEKVLIPGDPEKVHEKLVEKLGGIPYHPNQIKYANDLAELYGVKKVQLLN
ncbi:L-sulfolactate dehydrogenase, partial [Trichostrongylus colubriformis]